MSTYRTVQVVTRTFKLPAIVLNEQTDDGYQMYCAAGWMRRTQAWLDQNTVPLDDDAAVIGLVQELRGRGMELTKEEVTNES